MNTITFINNLRFTVLFNIKHLIAGIYHLLIIYFCKDKHSFNLWKNIFHFCTLNIVNGITIKEYFEFNMTSSQMDLNTKFNYLTRNRQLQYYHSTHNNYFDVLLNNKLIFKDLCISYNFPVPNLLSSFAVTNNNISDLVISLKDIFNSITIFPIIIKPVYGLCGKGIFKVDSYDNNCNSIHISGFRKNLSDFAQYLLELDFREYIIEDFIKQHEVLQLIFSNAANTVRVQTFNYNNNIIIAGALLKYGTGDTCVDNIGKNQLYSIINTEKGITTKTLKINGNTISDTLRDDYIEYLDVHPDSNRWVTGIHIPHWADVLALTYSISNKFNMFTSIGWDIAIGKHGPIVLEGNADWTAKYQQIAGGGIYKGAIKKIIDESIHRRSTV